MCPWQREKGRESPGVTPELQGRLVLGPWEGSCLNGAKILAQLLGCGLEDFDLGQIPPSLHFPYL